MTVLTDSEQEILNHPIIHNIYENNEYLPVQIVEWANHNNIDKTNYDVIFQDKKLFNKFHSLLKKILFQIPELKKDLNKVVVNKYSIISQWVEDIEQYKQNKIKDDYFDYALGALLDVLGIAILERELDKLHKDLSID